MRHTERLLDTVDANAGIRAAMLRPYLAELEAADARERGSIPLDACLRAVTTGRYSGACGRPKGHSEPCALWWPTAAESRPPQCPTDEPEKPWKVKLYSDGRFELASGVDAREGGRRYALMALDADHGLLTQDDAGNVLLAVAPKGEAFVLVAPDGTWDLLRGYQPDDLTRAVWAEVARLLVAVPRELLP